jgi:hypothetical protein
MQVLVQKVGDVARVQQTEKSDHASRQQQFLEHITQQTEANSSAVNQASANESVLIREKQEQKKKARATKKDRKREETEENKTQWISDPDRVPISISCIRSAVKDR